MTEHGNIYWSELISKDVEGSKKFFIEIAGWTVNEVPMPEGIYNVCMNGDRPVAGIMSLEMLQADHEIPPHWMTYIAVDDIDAEVAKVTGLGGVVIRPAFDVPDVGRIAMVQDPGGAVVGLMTPAETG